MSQLVPYHLLSSEQDDDDSLMFSTMFDYEAEESGKVEVSLLFKILEAEAVIFEISAKPSLVIDEKICNQNVNVTLPICDVNSRNISVENISGVSLAKKLIGFKIIINFLMSHWSKI